ncbi:regulatory signaling modulator protein AmpE [Algicola sagamiensis]|uniref:regulatory signaling modulator protein AmpE n=1 Tax=Algicola sagamiensis TaxID=163869 RepID=UPI001FE0FC94|nr:regulatory signaling modulator protein AmpE [Algicola sagamiensis]
MSQKFELWYYVSPIYQRIKKSWGYTGWIVASLCFAFGLQELVGAVPFLADMLVAAMLLRLCLGSVSRRQSYKAFLNAAGREDIEACIILAEKMGCYHEAYCQNKFGQHLIWVNFRYYAAVIFWFVCLGIFGAITYALLRMTVPAYQESCNLSRENRVLMILDWLPSRIYSLGFLFVGEFTKGAQQWITNVLLPHRTPYQFLGNIALASGILPESHESVCVIPSQMVALAKRTMTFFLTFVALLSLFGVVQ